MSLNFWLTLTSALVLFLIALGIVQVYKSGLVQNIRAQFLRKRLRPVVDQIGSYLIRLANENSDISDNLNNSGNYVGSELDYALRRKRAELEYLYSRTSILYQQERASIDSILASVSKLSFQLENNSVDRHLLESTVLACQRTSIDLAELTK